MSEHGEWFEYPHNIPGWGPGDIVGVVHAALLHTGRILFITADETTMVWDPDDPTEGSFQIPRNQPHEMPEGYSQLCSHHVFLSDGRLLVVGGGGYGPHELARAGYKFDPDGWTWARTSNAMSHHRWYPTAVVLRDKRVLVVCGHGSGDMDVYDESTDTFAEVKLEELGFPSLYPGLHLLPSSRVFYTRTGWGEAGAGRGPFPGDDVSAYFELTGPTSGVWTKIAGTDPGPADRTKGMSVMLLGRDRPTVRMLVVGGSDSRTNDTYELLDATSLTPASTWTAPIPFPDGQHRSLASAVLLPDGTVFMAGGTGGRGAPCGIFDPATDQWSPAAELPSVRDYHSLALLLPSAKVMMAGWQNPKIEIFSPPYLFRGDRPAIIEVPRTIRHGDRFWVQVGDPESIARAVLARPMAVTHQTDGEQRIIELPIVERHRSGLLLAAPDWGDPHALAPSGYYMLFVLNHEGVPSIAQWIRIVSLSWHGWHPVGDPEAGHTVPYHSWVFPASRSQGRLDIFVIGHNGGIYTSGQTGGGAWETWHSIGNPAAGHTVPTNSVVWAVSRKDDRIDVFVVGDNGGIYTSGQTGGGDWETWHSIGNPAAGHTVPIRSVVSAVSRNDDRIDVFVVGHNGGIYTSGQTGGGAWETWHSIGNPAAGHTVPTNSVVWAVSRNDNRIDVFVVGDNGGIYTSGQTGGGAWEPWQPVGDPDAGHTVPTQSVVTAVSRSPDRIDIFVVGHNGGIYTSGQTGGGAWETWHPIGDPDAGHTVPTYSVVWAASRSPDRIDIFVVGDNGGIYTSGQTGGGAWEPWQPVGDPDAGHTVPTHTTVSAASHTPDHLDIFVVGHNQGIYTNRFGY